MSDPDFKPISTLSFFASEQVMFNAEINDKHTTLQANIQPTDDQYLFLYDETTLQKVFAPLQFHMHAPSEHTFNGKHYDLELHIVHKNTDATELSVIGVFFDRVAGGNTSNWFIEELLQDSEEEA
jgi:carbonic anhydrase